MAETALTLPDGSTAMALTVRDEVTESWPRSARSAGVGSLPSVV